MAVAPDLADRLVVAPAAGVESSRIRGNDVSLFGSD